MRLLLWYIAAVFLFGPILAAPLTGGESLFLYVMPFFIFDFTNWNIFTIGCWAQLAWFVVSFFIWIMHQFIRMTVRHNIRKLRAQALLHWTYRQAGISVGSEYRLVLDPELLKEQYYREFPDVLSDASAKII